MFKLENKMIWNFCPHDVNIIDKNSVEFKKEIRKYITDKPVILHKIPSDGMLSVQFKETVIGTVNEIDIYQKKITKLDEFPDYVNEGSIVIVSGLYGNFSNDDRCHTIINPVYDIEGKKVIGCLGLGKVNV